MVAVMWACGSGCLSTLHHFQASQTPGLSIERKDVVEVARLALARCALQNAVDDAGNSRKGHIAGEKVCNGHFVGGVQCYTRRCPRVQGLRGQLQTRKALEVGCLEIEPPDLSQAQ